VKEQAPYKGILSHGFTLDGEGRKMSKSLGNGVDPLEVIEKYGADALRFTLISGTTPGNDTRFHWEKVEASRNFANKLWNASRFVLMNLEGFGGPSAGGEPPLDLLEDADRWILTRLQDAVGAATRLLERYELGEASRVVYDFIWDEFCDWYIELVKPRLYADAGDSSAPGATSRRVAQATLRYVLDQTLRLLHPFMPFVTEAIWQQLPRLGEALVIAEWPVARDELRFADAAARLETAKDIIRHIRNLRAELNVPPGRKAPVLLQAGGAAAYAVLEAIAPYVHDLGRASELSYWQAGSADHAAPSADDAATAVASGVEIFLPLRGLIDVERETARLEKERAAAAAEAEKLLSKLSNPGFLAKAPAAVVEKDRARAAELTQQVETIGARLEALRKL
jgi:valyl-tRNA synthetase